MFIALRSPSMKRELDDTERVNSGKALNTIIPHAKNHTMRSHQNKKLCALCGKSKKDENVYKFTEFIHLCDDCLNYVDALPEMTQKSIEKFLNWKVMQKS